VEQLVEEQAESLVRFAGKDARVLPQVEDAVSENRRCLGILIEMPAEGRFQLPERAQDDVCGFQVDELAVHALDAA
jgi:hypothetical protein